MRLVEDEARKDLSPSASPNLGEILERYRPEAERAAEEALDAHSHHCERTG